MSIDSKRQKKLAENGVFFIVEFNLLIDLVLKCHNHLYIVVGLFDLTLEKTQQWLCLYSQKG